jgi:hypothetical protein
MHSTSNRGQVTFCKQTEVAVIARLSVEKVLKMYKTIKTAIILWGLVLFAGCIPPRNYQQTNNDYYENNNYKNPEETKYNTSSEPDIYDTPDENNDDYENPNYPNTTSSYPRKKSTIYSKKFSAPSSKSEFENHSDSEDEHVTQKLNNSSLSMVSKYSSRYDYSFFYPQGWYLHLRKNSFALFKSKKDINEFQYHMIFIKNPKALATPAKRYITLFLDKLAKRNGWKYHILNVNKLSNKHQTAGITFITSNLKGFGLSLVKSDRIIFMIGFGKKSTYQQINAPVVLAYIFRSMVKGKNVTTPVIPLKYITKSWKLPPKYPQFLQKTASKSHMGITNFWYSMYQIIPISLSYHPFF